MASLLIMEIIKVAISQALTSKNVDQMNPEMIEAIKRYRLLPLSSSRKSIFTEAIYRHLERRARDGRSG
jgi:hypothetical protein